MQTFAFTTYLSLAVTTNVRAESFADVDDAAHMLRARIKVDTKSINFGPDHDKWLAVYAEDDEMRDDDIEDVINEESDYEVKKKGEIIVLS